MQEFGVKAGVHLLYQTSPTPCRRFPARLESQKEEGFLQWCLFVYVFVNSSRTNKRTGVRLIVRLIKFTGVRLISVRLITFV